MRILVVSDTHGDLERFDRVLSKLEKESPVDMIVHCGDCYEDALNIRMSCGIPVAAVKGNCDHEFSETGFLLLATEAGDFLVTYGHMENVGQDLQRLYYKALENDCIGALFGHTHRGVFTEIDGVYLMNPGSLSRPRDGSGGSFGIIETDDDQVCGKIYRYKEFTEGQAVGPSGGLRPKSGRLRRLLNDSDRL